MRGENYLTQRKMTDTYVQDNAGVITHSKLQAFNFCPTFYKLKYVDKVTPPEESDALLFGSAFDLYIQDEKKFDEKYHVVGVRFDVHKKLQDKQMTLEELKAEIEKIEGEIQAKEKEGKATTALKTRLEKKADKIQESSKELKELKQIAGKEQLTTTMGERLIACLTELKRHPLYSFDSKTAQTIIEIKYKGYKLRGKMDDFDKDNAMIDDVKTTASIDRLLNSQYMDKYKSQLAFYQFLVQVKHDVLCDGKLTVVSKEDVPKAVYLHASKESLLDHRPVIITLLDEMIKNIELGIYPAAESREKCLKCPAYGVCPYSIQKEYVEI